MGLRHVQGDRARPNISGAFGRYSLHDAIAKGDTSTVHLGLLEGASGFRKPVAIKRLLPLSACDRTAIARLAYEACVLAQIHHPSVIQVLDLVEATGESYLVMEYVLGDTLAGLVKSGARCSVDVAVAIVADALRGLDAAHSARGAGGQPLRIVHRNVCPENLLVGVDGVTRVIDFGSSFSTSATQTSLPDPQPNVAYAAPEQLMQQAVDRRADIFAMGIVLWETLTGKRMFRNPSARDAFRGSETQELARASAFNADVPRALDAVVFRALGWLPQARFETAGEFAAELEAAVTPGDKSHVAEYVERKAAASLKLQRSLLSAVDAPSGRISEPPAVTSGDFDDATAIYKPEHHLLQISDPTNGRSNEMPAHIDQLRTRLATIVEQNSDGSRASGFVTTLAAPWRSLRSARTEGSTLLTGVAVALLLLAGVKLSSGTTATAASPSLAPQAAAAETPRAPQQASQPARRDAVAASDLPPDPPVPSEVARTQAAPRGSAADTAPEPDTTRPKPAKKPAASCDPPYTLDPSGIKRLKLQCI